jgi:hypothetical protein
MRVRLLRDIAPWRVHLALFVLLALCYLYAFPRWADWNQNSRFNLVLALVHDHSSSIDPYVGNTGDYAFYQGHYYSDKAPGLSLLGVPVYAAFQAIMPPALIGRLGQIAEGSESLGATLRPDGTRLRDDKVGYFLGLTVTTALTVALPSALLGVLMYTAAATFMADQRARLATAILYGLATIAFPYSNTFVGHQPSAYLLFAAFALLLAIRWRQWSPRWLLGVGWLLGYATITEYPTVLIGGVLAFYAVWTARQRLRGLALLGLGGLPPLLILAAYDLATFGTILPVGYLHSTLWTDVHSVGLVSLTYPRLDALWGITFGPHRGLFFLSPFLLFALVGYRVLWHRRELRPEWSLLALTPLVFVLFNGSSSMWQGGFAVGPRYLLPALPFLALVGGVGLGWAWTRTPLRLVAIIAVGCAVFAVWTQTLGGQSFPDYTANPLFDLSLPRLARGDVARNLGMALGLTGWASLLPLLAGAAAIGTAFLRPGGSAPPGGQAATVGRGGRVRWVVE